MIRSSFRLPVFRMCLAAVALVAAPSVSALEFDPGLAVGRNALLAGDLPAARSAFASAVAAEPGNEKALVALALTDLASLYDMPAVAAFLDRMSFPAEGRDPYDWTSMPDLDVNRLSAGANLNEIRSVVRDGVLPALSGAVDHLSVVSSPGFSILFRPEYFGLPATGDVVEADLTDVMLVRAGLLAAGAALRLGVASNDLDVAVESLVDLIDGRGVTLETLLAGHPALGTLVDPQARELAGAYLDEAIRGYVNAAPELRRPERRHERLFYIESWQLAEEADFRATLLDILAVLEGPGRLNALPPTAAFLSTADLRPLFGTLDFRAYLPDVRGDYLVAESIADPTAQGLFPLATVEDWTHALGRGGFLWIEPVPMDPRWPWLPRLHWTTSSYGAWQWRSDGSARSGPIARTQKSWIEAEVHGPGMLSFDWGLETSWPSVLEFAAGPRAAAHARTFGASTVSPVVRLGGGLSEVRWLFHWGGRPIAEEQHGWLSSVTFTPHRYFPVEAAAGATHIELRVISNDGGVVGGTHFEGDRSFAAIDFGRGELEKLPGVWFRPPEVVGNQSMVSAVSRDDRRLAGRVIDRDGVSLPVVWESGLWGISQPTVLPTPDGGGNSGMAIGFGGGDSAVIVGRVRGAGGYEPAVWREVPWGGSWSLERPGFLEGHTSDGWLYSVSRDGRTAVGWSERHDVDAATEAPAIDVLPMVWTTDGGLSSLPLPAGATGGRASYISPGGSVAVGEYLHSPTGESEIHAVVLWHRDGSGWRAEAIPSPEEVPHMGTTPLPRVTDDGDLVLSIGARLSAANDWEYFEMIWERGRGWTGAREFLNRLGLDMLDNSVLLDRVIMSADGSHFAGVIHDANGHALGFVYAHPNPLVHFSARLGTERYRNPWMGNHAVIGEWTYEPVLGWQKYHPEISGGLFFRDVRLGRWGWTRADVFPWVHWIDSGEWTVGRPER